MRSTKKMSTGERDRLEVAFKAGEIAFGEGQVPLDNPHFADSDSVDLFDAWSDGWLAGRSKGKGRRQTREQATWRAKHGSMRGFTASWSCR